MLEYLRQRLINSGITVPVYINFTPPDPDTSITLREYEGRFPDSGHLYDRPSFQVTVRSKSHNTARSLALQVYTQFQDAPNMLDSAIIDIRATQSPYFGGQDNQERYVFVQSFHTEIQRGGL